MLFPWELAEFRAALDAGPVKAFAGRMVNEARITLATGGSTGTILENTQDIAFRGPTKIFGTACEPGCLTGVHNSLLNVPAKIVYQIPDASIIGATAAIDRAGRLYCPTLVQTPQEADFWVRMNNNNSDGFILKYGQDRDLMAYYFSAGEKRVLDGVGLFIANPERNNYGSFIFRVLPQLFLAKEAGCQFDFYVSMDRTPWLAQALEMIGLPRRPIYLSAEVCGESVRSLIMFNFFYPEGLFTGSTRSAFLQLAATQASGSGGGPQSLYVSRALSRLAVPQYRMLENELDIEDMMRQADFTVVYPETLDFGTQISLFRQATRVAGPSGSGMLNSVFAPDGGKVLDLESYTVAVRQHAKIYSSTGKDYAFGFGAFAGPDTRDLHVRPWSMKPQTMTEAMDWLRS